MGSTSSSPVQKQEPSVPLTPSFPPPPPGSALPPPAPGMAPYSFRPSAASPTQSNDGVSGKEAIPAVAEETGPGTFEDLHRKCKDIFPVPFEGAKLVVNKGLSNHFQISHSLTMSALVPSGYKFGCTYVGDKLCGPNEAYPVMMAETDFCGNQNGTIVHQLTKALRCRLVSQIQNNKCVVAQLTSDFKGKDFVASLTIGNPNILNGSGVVVGQFLQNVTKRLALGSELLYQYGPTVPGGQISIYTLAGRYSGDNYQVSTSLTPVAGGVHICYYQKANDTLQIGVELEGSLRTQECTATLGYQLELPKANLTFRGQVDSNWCVGAVLEKKLMPLPFTFALSGFANHVKGAYRFGIGLIVG